MKYDFLKVICVGLCCVFTLFSCVGSRRYLYHENKTADTVTLAASRKTMENIRSSIVDTIRVYQRGDTVFSDKIRVYYYQRTNTDTTATAEKNKSISTSTTKEEQKKTNWLIIGILAVFVVASLLLSLFSLVYLFRRR